MSFRNIQAKREYDLKRYYEKRKTRIELLGGKCFVCGSIKDLEFDHKNREEKKFDVSKWWYLSEKKFRKELDKCQLLCQKCHNLKTLGELGKKVAKGKHGTISTYRYCHCHLCREAKNIWFTNWRKTHTRITVNGKRKWITIKLPLDNG